MASEVIELGSSDDESEPTPKKSKPLPNAMVHIPNKLPGITIKPAKSEVNAFTNRVNRKVATITSMPNIMINPCSIKVKSNGKMPNPLMKQILKPPLRSTTIGNNHFRNPGHHRMPIVQTKNTKNSINIPRNIIKTQAAGYLSNLPSTITVKRTKIVPKRVVPYTITNARKKPKLSKEVLTVDLVDDDSASTSGPLWYLRPEEQADSLKLEEQNNAEPENSKLVEITIEDSPVKPVHPNKTIEARLELSITIDDSPVKTIINKNVHPNGSDEEIVDKKEYPHSKKKLEYPKSENDGEDSNKIEIVIENCTTAVEKSNSVEQLKNDVSYIVEIEESPLKQDEPMQHSTPKKKCPVKPYLNNVEFEVATKTKEESGEFHPVYQSFIDLCFQLENSDDMKKIVEKKIKSYYRQVPKVYTESEEFIDMVSSKMLSMKSGPEKMYLYIKDIVDELNFKRKLTKSQVISEEIKTTDIDKTNKHLYGEDSEFDSKRQRQIRRLEKTLKKLHRAIQKLEEQEVDFDDDEDSVYLLTERYKERLVRVHAKFCQLTNTKMPSEPRVQIDARPGQPKGPAKLLEKFINKKVPIGTPLPFPDFHDVLRCVRDANEEDDLGWNEADIMEEARDLFTRCGKKLQRRRQENEWRLAASRISVDADPAENSEELKKKLHQNMQIAVKKEAEVFNKYADRQNLLKLEAEEIGDKEAEESPVESEEDDANADDESLETTEKRKDRLKRLLHEKCKKNAEEKKPSQPVDLDDKPETCPDTNRGETTDLHNKTRNEENDIDKNVKDITENDFKTHRITTETNNGAIDNEKTEVEVIESVENKPTYNSDNNMQVVSDDSDKIESDIDELHLLQKLHSENDINTSTVESSDTDTQNAISDTLGSSSDNKKPPSDDVISIENSSYSESETNVEKHDSIEGKTADDNLSEEIVEPVSDVIAEIKTNENILNKSNNDEYNDSIENILLASSEEDEDEGTNKGITESGNVCVNLKDDAISIGDTIVGGQSDATAVVVLDEGIPDKQNAVDTVTNIDENRLKEDNKEQESSQSFEMDAAVKMNEEKRSLNAEDC